MYLDIAIGLIVGLVASIFTGETDYKLVSFGVIAALAPDHRLHCLPPDIPQRMGRTRYRNRKHFRAQWSRQFPRTLRTGALHDHHDLLYCQPLSHECDIRHHDSLQKKYIPTRCGIINPEYY